MAALGRLASSSSSGGGPQQRVVVRIKRRAADEPLDALVIKRRATVEAVSQLLNDQTLHETEAKKNVKGSPSRSNRDSGRRVFRRVETVTTSADAANVASQAFHKRTMSRAEALASRRDRRDERARHERERAAAAWRTRYEQVATPATDELASVCDVIDLERKRAVEDAPAEYADLLREVLAEEEAKDGGWVYDMYLMDEGGRDADAQDDDEDDDDAADFTDVVRHAPWDVEEDDLVFEQEDYVPSEFDSEDSNCEGFYGNDYPDEDDGYGSDSDAREIAAGFSGHELSSGDEEADID